MEDDASNAIGATLGMPEGDSYLRYTALSWAVSVGEEKTMTVERAEAYLAFLRA